MEKINQSISSILALLEAKEHIVEIVRHLDLSNVKILDWQKQELTNCHQALIDETKSKIIDLTLSVKKNESKIILSKK